MFESGNFFRIFIVANRTDALFKTGYFALGVTDDAPIAVNVFESGDFFVTFFIIAVLACFVSVPADDFASRLFRFNLNEIVR